MTFLPAAVAWASLAFNSLPAATPEETVLKFYNELHALDLRNSIDAKDADKFLPVFTPALRKEFQEAQKRVDSWMEKAKGHPEEYRDLKPPPDEGCILSGNDEGGSFGEIQGKTETGDRCYLVVRITPPDIYAKTSSAWRETLILHHIDDQWLIDDILFPSVAAAPRSLRSELDHRTLRGSSEIDRLHKNEGGSAEEASSARQE